jgi:murein L,D-transpeptidase YafK
MELSVGLPKTVGLLEKKNQAQMRERRHGPLVDWWTGWDRGSAGILGGREKEMTKGVNRREKRREYQYKGKRVSKSVETKSSHEIGE